MGCSLKFENHWPEHEGDQSWDQRSVCRAGRGLCCASRNVSWPCSWSLNFIQKQQKRHCKCLGKGVTGTAFLPFVFIWPLFRSGNVVSAEVSASGNHTWQHGRSIFLSWVVLILTMWPSSYLISLLCFSSLVISSWSFGRPLKTGRMFIPCQKFPLDLASIDDFCWIHSFLCWLQNGFLCPAFSPHLWDGRWHFAVNKKPLCFFFSL